MKNTTFVFIILGLVLLLGGYFAWHQISSQFNRLESTIGELEERAEKAEQRATEAEENARQASSSANEAADRATTAIEREQVSLIEAQQAEEAKASALAAEEQAEAARQQAEAQAEAQAAARATAEEQRAEAELELDSTRVELQVAREETEQARQETEAAKAEVERVRAKMERELDRMQRSLSRIATTRRTALGLVMTLDSGTIEFDFNKATLRPANREVLSRIAGVLLTFENYGIQVFGHTDDVGTEQYNLDLSKRRAETVEKYLAEAGISRDVMSTTGMGEGDPLVEGTDDVSRQRNRRVELAIVFSEGEYEAIQDGEGAASVEAAG